MLKNINAFSTPVILFLLQVSLNTHAQSPHTPFERKYKPGDVYRYRLTTQSSYNGQPPSKTISICELTVVTDSAGVPFDEVRWLSQKTISGSDTSDFSGRAKTVKPYRISLHPNGTVNLPPIEVSNMTGEITDFNTFIAAVSPKMEVTQLQKKGDHFSKKDLAKGNFANGKDIVKGMDCLQVSMSFLDQDETQVKLLTSFQPPATPCLDYLLEEMKTPVTQNTINNFQMVRPQKDKYNVLYGRESFDINTSIRKKDGKITEATMTNVLSLKLKQNCDGAYKNCQFEMPFSINRQLTLELID